MTTSTSSRARTLLEFIDPELKKKEKFKQFQDEVVLEIELRKKRVSDLLRRLEAKD